MNRTVVVAIIFIVTCASTCRKDENCPSNGGHNGLTIKNNSSVRICYEIYWNYPDTAIGEYNPVFNGTDGISPGESRVRGAGPNSCWESVFLDNKKEWIYFFEADTIENLEWQLVRNSSRGLLERKEIDLNYLEQNDFTVTYN